MSFLEESNKFNFSPFSGTSDELNRDEIYNDGKFSITEILDGRYKGVYEFWAMRTDKYHPNFLGSMGDRINGHLSMTLRESISSGMLPENIVNMIKLWRI